LGKIITLPHFKIDNGYPAGLYGLKSFPGPGSGAHFNFSFLKTPLSSIRVPLCESAEIYFSPSSLY